MSIATLSWDPPPTDFLLVEAQYRRVGSTDWQIALVPPESTSAEISGLEEGVEYEFRIRHRSSPTGRASEWVPPLDLVMGPAPGSANVLNLVADFGADPTGATDSTAAIVAWLSAGGDLYAPPGDYLIQYAGPDSGGAVATITASITVTCAPGCRFFTDTAQGVDNDMIRIQVPPAGTGLPPTGIDVIWRGGFIDQSQQKVSLVVPFLAEYPPPTGKAGVSNTCDGLSISGGFTVASQDFLGMNRIEVSGVQIDAGAHWQVAGGDAGIVVAGAKQISVHDCTFNGSRDLGIGNAAPTGRIDIYNNFASNCFNGYAVKRSVEGFLIRGNKAVNCVIGAIGTGNAAGQILGNSFDACQVEMQADLSHNLYIAGNRGVNFGAYLADGTTPVTAYVPSGILLQGVTYSTITDNGTDGVSAGYVALTPSYLHVQGIDPGTGTVSSENNRIANNISVDFWTIGGETPGEANSNQFEGNWGFNAVVPNIVASGALSSVRRHDYNLGRNVYQSPLLFLDGTPSEPTVARFGDPTTGFYFGANTIGASRALIRAPATTLTATGTDQATAFQTVAELNDFSTVAAGTGALLRAAVSGTVQVINNRGANDLLIYPQAGGQINTLAVNAPFTLTAGGFTVFYCTLTNRYRCGPPIV